MLLRSKLLLGFSLLTGLSALAASCAQSDTDTGFKAEGGASGDGGGDGSGGKKHHGTGEGGSTATENVGGYGYGGFGDGGRGEGGYIGAGGGGYQCNYDAAKSCFSAEDIGTIDGDDDNGSLVKHGTTSAWFKFTLYENSYGDNDMSYRATLESPTGMSFALFVYEGDAAGASCSDPTQGFGSPPSVHTCWDECYYTCLDHDDTHVVIVEVRYVSGNVCGPDATWTLTIEGNVDEGDCG